MPSINGLSNSSRVLDSVKREGDSGRFLTFSGSVDHNKGVFVSRDVYIVSAHQRGNSDSASDIYDAVGKSTDQKTIMPKLVSGGNPHAYQA